MPWVWLRPSHSLDVDVRYDYKAPNSVDPAIPGLNKPIDPSLTPVFRTRNGLRSFKKLHCPGIDGTPTVDRTWQDIILQFVPKDRVQFLPVRLIARGGEVCEDFSWVITFDSVKCIDPARSKIHDHLMKGDRMIIFAGSNYTYHDGCMGDRHLARDTQNIRHLIVSDALRDALASTGEDSMFRRPENSYA